MMREKLEKYSPLGLLALAIVAGVVAVLAHNPPNKDDDRFGAEYDAGFDVISYFHCSLTNNIDYKYDFVLVREQQGYSVLDYDYPEKNLFVAAGKPEDLSYFRKAKISEAVESPSQFIWYEVYGEEGGGSYFLKRSNGNLTGSFSIKGIKPYTHNYKCKFGEEAKKLVWKRALTKYERHVPKF
jgi:hypothetical protein